MASVGGPMFFSNIYAYSNLNMIVPFISYKMNIHSNGLHMIFNKDMLMAFPMTAWFSHNKQLIKTKTHKLHNAYHNSFLNYFPMSSKSHKTRIILNSMA